MIARAPVAARPIGQAALRLAAALKRDQRGVSALEFALVSPLFLTLLIGVFDIGQMAYGTAMLNGAVQKAARDSSLESANTATADSMVSEMVAPVLPGATFTSKRTSYYDFADIGRPEKWNDANNDGTCNSGELYVDEIENGRWDQDVGASGNGGANDVVVYSVSVTYDPTFKIPFLPEQWATRTLKSTAIKKNQPFANQKAYGSNSGMC